MHKSWAEKIKLKKGERYYVVVSGSFFFGDFIEAFIVKNNLKVTELTISTLSMCENNIDSLKLLMMKYVRNLNLIISDYFFAHERNNLVKYIYQELDVKNRLQLAVAGTHCKLCLMETLCGKKIVMHGSANLRSSGNIEQFVIEENAQLYDFNDEYQRRILEKYKTINKSIRGKELWRVVQENKAAEKPEAKTQQLNSGNTSKK